MPNHETLLTSTQAGVLLSKSGRTVTRLADAGELPIAHKLPGPNGAYLYREADVLAVKERIAAKALAAESAA